MPYVYMDHKFDKK